MTPFSDSDSRRNSRQPYGQNVQGRGNLSGRQAAPRPSYAGSRSSGRPVSQHPSRPQNPNPYPGRAPYGQQQRSPYPPQGSRYPRPGEKSDRVNPYWSPSPYPQQGNRYPYGSGPSGRRPEPKRGSRQARTKQGKKTSRWVLALLDIGIVAVLGAAVFFLLKPIIMERQVERYKANTLERLQRNPNETIIEKVDKNFGKVFGESAEPLPPGVEFVDNDADLPDSETITVNFVGRLVIPRIGCNTPLSLDYGVMPSIRFSAGIHGSFANLLDPGLTNIFGHRYLTKGRDFNRLNEMEPGDQFYIDYNVDGLRHFYKVTEVKIIPREEIQERVYDQFEQKTLCLITCHPPNYSDDSERLLVYAVPDDSMETIAIPAQNINE